MITKEDFGMKFTENPTSCGQWFCAYRDVCVEYGYVDNDGVITRALGPWPEIPKSPDQAWDELAEMFRDGGEPEAAEAMGLLKQAAKERRERMG